MYRRHTAALFRALPDQGNLPDWIELLPAGTDVQGRDGRRFRNIAPEAITKAFAANAADLPIDWEHASELQAPKGKPAPAAGWIKQLQARDDGSLWGQVEWTPRGAGSVTSREYRFISPVFTHDRSGRIHALLSAALTNMPNLRLTALNSEGVSLMEPEVLEVLGLDPGASASEIVAAVTKLKEDVTRARNQARAPSLDEFVPRADYETALNRATKAEACLQDSLAKQQDKEIEGELKAALEAGKITPSTIDYHRAQCRQDGGLERFRAFVEAAPVVAPDMQATTKPKAPTTDSLGEVQRVICRTLGVEENTYRETLGEEGQHAH